MRGRAERLVGVVRNIVEEHQARAHRILEVQDVQAGRGLVQAIAVAAAVEAKQAADQQALCETTSTVPPAYLTTVSRIMGKARARTLIPDSPPTGAKVKGSASQSAYSSA